MCVIIPEIGKVSCSRVVSYITIRLSIVEPVVFQYVYAPVVMLYDKGLGLWSENNAAMHEEFM